ncbi:hypothetical protein MHYP_G00118130 [Metynnis hypsauchen]
MLMTLKDIVDLVMSPVHTEESICYLDSIISEHRSRFLDVFPQHKLIPKHHFLEHYPQLIREFGPLAALWTMRFEAKHSFFKRVVRHTGCFRNILLSLANKHQLMVAYYQSHAVKPSLAVTKTTEVSLDVLKDDLKDLVKCRFPAVTAVHVANNVCSLGTNYAVGMLLCCGSTAGLADFSEVLQIMLLPVNMAPSAKLRIIFGEDDVCKLLLPAGIPSTLQDLNDVLRETFDITGPFTVMYQDMDFDGQFFTLTSIEEVQDKANLKVVKTEPVILSLTPVDMSEADSPVPVPSMEASSSSSGSNTILLSSPDESGPCYRSKPWPFKFEIPVFSYDVDLALEAGKQAYENDGTLLNNPRVTSSILEKLAETIFGFTAYPTGVQILAVAEALIKAEFKRITTMDLERTFLSRLDMYTTKLLEIFRRKGGTAGTKIKPMLDSVNEHHVDGRRDIIMHCLVEYLGESGEELIKDYQDISQEAVKEDCSNHMMKITVIHPSVAQETQDPVYVSVIIEGSEVLDDCRSVTNACLLLMGVIYTVNLRYPLKLKYTFEVFQKLFLELDILKMSAKVQSLHKKLLA